MEQSKNMKQFKINVTTIGWGLIVSVLLLLVLFSYGVGNNFLSWDARQAGGGWKVLGTVFLLVSVYLAYTMISDKAVTSTGRLVLMVVFLVLSVCANVGFQYTGGNRNDRVTPFDTYGKVVDKKVLYDNYEDYYHFKTDTALKNYVEQYNELPGRNNHNHFIINGDISPSTAPRANEYFKWHGER